MSWTTTRSLLWKEWRESRLKFLALIGAFHLPLVGFIRAAHFLKQPDHDLFAFRLVEYRYLYATLFYQSAFDFTVGLFLVAFFSASAFAWDYEGSRVFFMFERPLTRARFLFVFRDCAGAARQSPAVDCGRADCRPGSRRTVPFLEPAGWDRSGRHRAPLYAYR